jgi:hypothetical protein
MADSRTKLVDGVKAAGGKDAGAWLKLLRFDYMKAKDVPSEAGWRKLLQSYRTALSQISSEQRRSAEFISILVDEARTQMCVGGREVYEFSRGTGAIEQRVSLCAARF